MEQMSQGMARLVVGLERRTAMLEANAYRNYFVDEGAGSLGQACIEGNKNYDATSKELKAKQDSGE
eukprot:3319161-Pyramimonas_sp.AAC.1